MVCRACGANIPPEAPACPACSCPVEEPLPFALGMVLEGRYRVEDVAGRGGMGVVYRGTDLTLNRPVAVKVMINAEPAILARFMREARSLAKVEHRGLVPVYAVGREEGTFYMVMKFIEGRTLSAMLKEGPLEPEALRRVLVETADALWSLHRAELIHRDMKPGNLIIGPDGRVTIMDLGIVKTVGEQTTAQMLGTPKYMPPEMLTNEDLDGRADLYSLGVIAYQAAEGEVPFDAPTPMGILYKHAHETPPPLTQKIPKDLSKVIFKLLAKEPGQRFKDAEAVISALTPNRRRRKRDLKTRRLLMGIGGLAALALIITWVAADRSGEPQRVDASVPNNGEVKVISVTAYTGNEPKPKPEPPKPLTPAPAQPDANLELPPPPPLSAEITVRITSKPPAVQVLHDGKHLGQTPLTLKRPRGTPRAKLSLMKVGYSAKWLKVDFNDDHDLKVTLSPDFQLVP